ncbi:MAG: hypothetical protein PUI85_03490 [Eubacteriales bacterium]|nr:hypothetical protein [Eubacteriales bacterium]MDY3333265.1 hypothetical protein [Gallibacter sp.]
MEHSNVIIFSIGSIVVGVALLVYFMSERKKRKLNDENYERLDDNKIL